MTFRIEHTKVLGKHSPMEDEFAILSLRHGLTELYRSNEPDYPARTDPDWVRLVRELQNDLYWVTRYWGSYIIVATETKIFSEFKPTEKEEAVLEIVAAFAGNLFATLVLCSDPHHRHNQVQDLRRKHSDLKEEKLRIWGADPLKMERKLWYDSSFNSIHENLLVVLGLAKNFWASLAARDTDSKLVVSQLGKTPSRYLYKVLETQLEKAMDNSVHENANPTSTTSLGNWELAGLAWGLIPEAVKSLRKFSGSSSDWVPGRPHTKSSSEIANLEKAKELDLEVQLLYGSDPLEKGIIIQCDARKSIRELLPFIIAENKKIWNELANLDVEGRITVPLWDHVLVRLADVPRMLKEIQKSGKRQPPEWTKVAATSETMMTVIEALGSIHRNFSAASSHSLTRTPTTTTTQPSLSHRQRGRVGIHVVRNLEKLYGGVRPQ
ncbi:hypothetical protein T439DRAFT_359868 [Meredithblackwellia eburnea MCA 4105]